MNPQCEVRNKKKVKKLRNRSYPYKKLGRLRTINLDRHITKESNH